jgi:TldD protein
MTLFEWIELAASLGVDGVEMYPGFFESLEPDYLDRVREGLERFGLEAPMMCASPDFTTPDVDARRAEIEREKEIIDVTARLGGRNCRVLSGQRRQEVSRADGVRWTVESITSLLDYGRPEPVRLAPQKGYGEVSWRTPIEKNGFDVPVGEKADLLRTVAETALKAGASFINSNVSLVNEQKYFASTDGSYIDQDIHRIGAGFGVIRVDKATGKFERRDALSAPMGMGWEYLAGRPAGKRAGPTTMNYADSYDMVEDAVAAAEQTKEKAAAKSVVAGKYDLVLDPSHLWLTIHESVGHPLELDRVLGHEANYAGTSFATLDKWRSKTFRYGSPVVNLVADRKQRNSLGATGWDDEGVPAKEWMLVKDGILVDYQKIRDQAHVVGQAESDGCCYADSWDEVQFQRMPNVSLRPGTAPLTPAQMIADVEKGIYIVGDASYSIDQQRYNFQFSGQLFYEIRNGKIAGMLRDVAYQSNTQEFWNSCAATCDQRDYRLGGSFNDGKGQPSQSSSVSHGSSTTHFTGVNVINTARKI